MHAASHVFQMLSRLPSLPIHFCMCTSLEKVLGCSCGLASSVIAAVPSRLCADSFDLSLSSGQVDAKGFLPQEVSAQFSDAVLFFRHVPPGLGNCGGVSKADKAEYAKLVCRQVRISKVIFLVPVVCGLCVSCRRGGGGGQAADV